MNIQSEKLRLIELLLHTNNPSIIEKIKSIFRSEEAKDIWEQLSKDQQTEIDIALKEVQDGNTVGFDSVVAKHK